MSDIGTPEIFDSPNQTSDDEPPDTFPSLDHINTMLETLANLVNQKRCLAGIQPDMASMNSLYESNSTEDSETGGMQLADLFRQLHYASLALQGLRDYENYSSLHNFLRTVILDLPVDLQQEMLTLDMYRMPLEFEISAPPTLAVEDIIAEQKSKKRTCPFPDEGPSRKRVNTGTVPVVDVSNIARPFATTSTLKFRSLVIGQWSTEYSDKVQTVAKFYFAKKQFVWIITDVELKSSHKMVINFSDVDAIHFSLLQNQAARMEVTLNVLPKFFVQVQNDNFKHNKCYQSVSDFTNQNSLRHELIFDVGPLTNRHLGKLSHYEKLMLGDAWLSHISRTDPNFPIVAKDMPVKGVQSWQQLKDKMINLLAVCNRLIISCTDHMAYCINKGVSHKFKFRIHHQMYHTVNITGDQPLSLQDLKPEPCFALNLDDVLNLAKRAGETSDLMTKDEVHYFVSMAKLGENGISLFKQLRPQEEAPHSLTAEEIDNWPEFPPEHLLDEHPSPSHKDNHGHMKNIRVAVLLSKERLLTVLGDHVQKYLQNDDLPVLSHA